MERFIYSFTIILFFLIVTKAPAQAQDQNGRTSLSASISNPTAASLGKYGNIPVSLFTGTPNIQVPLFTLKGRSLSLPITLNYNGSGIKVEQVAGWAGLGWSLNAGGVITRTVRGLADDHAHGYLRDGGDSANVYLNEISSPLSVQYNPGTPRSLILNYIQDVYNRVLDGEPDDYFFNFAGRSGQIFFARDSTASPYHYRPYSRSQQDIRIKANTDANLQIDSWTITTEDGTVYTFGKKESSTQDINGQYYDYTSSWYLTKIKSPNSDDAISLSYQTGDLFTIYHNSATAFNNIIDTTLQSSGYAGCVPTDYVATQPTSASPLYLSEIKTAKQKAIFNIAGRTDGGGDRLASVYIENNTGTDTLRSYQLVHGYYNAGSSTTDSLRLRLDRLRQFDGAGKELPSWYFTYDNSHSLPARTSANQDYWGYYNGIHSGGLAPKITYNGIDYGTRDREPNASYAKTGILNKITYPTGGTTTFDYEGKYYYDSSTGDSLLGGGIRIKSITHYDGMNPSHDITLHYTYTDNSGQSSGVLERTPKFYNVHNYYEDFYSQGCVGSVESIYQTQHCYYLSRSSTSYVAPGMMQGSVIMYSRVTVSRGAGGSFGKTVTNYQIPAVTSYIVDWPYTPTTVESWRGGQVTFSNEMNSSGASVRSHTISYNSANVRSIPGVVVGVERIANCDAPGQYKYKAIVYRINSGAYLPVSETKSYSTGNAFVGNTTSYEYNNLSDSLVQVTGKTEINSDGQVRKTFYQYAWQVTNDGSEGTGLDYAPMKTLHMISEPYSVTIEDSAGNVLSKHWTLWSDSTGWWRPRGEWIWTGGNAGAPVFK